MAGNPYITQRLFKFLRELKQNNNREWFEANKECYEEEIREPLLAFIEDFFRPSTRFAFWPQRKDRRAVAVIPIPDHNDSQLCPAVSSGWE